VAISNINEAEQTSVVGTHLLIRIQEDRVLDIKFKPDILGVHEADNFDFCE